MMQYLIVVLGTQRMVFINKIYCSNLQPLSVSQVEIAISNRASVQPTQRRRGSQLVDSSSNGRQRDSASGSLRAFLLALDRKKQHIHHMLCHQKTSYMLSSLLLLDSTILTAIFPLWLPFYPQRSLASRSPQ